MKTKRSEGIGARSCATCGPSASHRNCRKFVLSPLDALTFRERLAGHPARLSDTSRRMRGDLFWLVCVVACGGGGSSSNPDGGNPIPDGGQQQDASLPPPPNQVCMVPAMPVDTSKPTTVVGTGNSGASCTEAAFRAAVATGGIVTFNCGGSATITVTSEVPVATDTTIDGNGQITLSGGGMSRILHITSAWNVSDAAAHGPEPHVHRRLHGRRAQHDEHEGGRRGHLRGRRLAHGHQLHVPTQPVRHERAGRVGWSDQRTGCRHAHHRGLDVLGQHWLERRRRRDPGRERDGGEHHVLEQLRRPALAATQATAATVGA